MKFYQRSFKIIKYFITKFIRFCETNAVDDRAIRNFTFVVMAKHCHGDENGGQCVTERKEISLKTLE